MLEQIAISGVEYEKLPVSFRARSPSSSSRLSLKARRRGSVTSRSENRGMDDLILRVAERQDREAFAELFSYFAPRLKAFLGKRGCRPDVAEELAQEAMVSVWRKARMFDPAKAAASTWIFTIARNLHIDRIRKESRPEPDVNDPYFVPDSDPSPDRDLERRQEETALHEVLDTLPKEQREILQLSFFDDLSHALIADRLDLPLGTVKSRVRLAMVKIRKGLEEVR